MIKKNFRFLTLSWDISVSLIYASIRNYLTHNYRECEYVTYCINIWNIMHIIKWIKKYVHLAKLLSYRNVLGLWSATERGLHASSRIYLQNNTHHHHSVIHASVLYRRSLMALGHRKDGLYSDYYIIKKIIYAKQWRSQPDNLVMLCKYFRVYRPWKLLISKEMNNDDLKFA